MKSTIILVVMSFLSIAECNPCGPSHFNTNSGCKKCFCSGVTDECHAGSFFTKTIRGIENLKVFVAGRNATYTVIKLNDIPYEAEYQFTEGDYDASFYWILPSMYYEYGARNYGSSLNLTHKLVKLEGGLDTFIHIHLISPEMTLDVKPEPIASSGNYTTFSIPLYESFWHIATESMSAKPTRSDMMRVLTLLTEIRIYITSDNGKTVSIKDISMILCVATEDAPPDSPRTDSIEICECPEGYSGESCETCSDYYDRNVKNRTKSIFGACELYDLQLPGSIY